MFELYFLFSHQTGLDIDRGGEGNEKKKTQIEGHGKERGRLVRNAIESGIRDQVR